MSTHETRRSTMSGRDIVEPELRANPPFLRRTDHHSLPTSREERLRAKCLRCGTPKFRRMRPCKSRLAQMSRPQKRAMRVMLQHSPATPSRSLLLEMLDALGDEEGDRAEIREFLCAAFLNAVSMVAL